MLSDDQRKAIRMEGPRRIPVSVGILPAVWMKHREALEEIVLGHPEIFPDYSRGQKDFDEVGGTYVHGRHVDEWGCVWSNLHDGMESIVTGHPVPRRQDIRTLRPPAEATGRLPHGFMFLRLFDLRGFEEMMVDFAEEPPELQRLIDLVLEHNLRNLEVLLERNDDEMIYFGDDNGMQASLPISPAKWRKYIQPCYKAIFGRCRAAGRLVYFHTDGCIWEAIPDMLDCGVDVLNPQFRANGLDNLARTCKGKVCVDLDLDRQMMPFASPADLDAHVRQCVEALGSPEGGLWVKAEIGPDVPLANVEAIFTALEKYRTLFTGAGRA